jgi:RNA polymerase-interacting CarD/CdnL/TRCF family regulator
MAFKRGEYVAYHGQRAGRVLGVKPVDVAGSRLDALAIALTASPGAVVHVPLRRVEASVTRITKREAALLDEHAAPVRTFTQNKMMRARAAKAAKALDFARMGGLAKAAKQRAG